MVDVFLDDRLPDYFTEVDGAKGLGGVFPSFLGEKLVCLRNLGLDQVDLAFLAGVSFPQTWSMKKFQFGSFLESYRLHGRKSPPYAILMNEVFAQDKRRTIRFIEQMEIISTFVDRVLAGILQSYVPQSVIKVCRFSETRMENLHFDIDEGSDEHEALRLYINVDSAPRIWHTSYQISDLGARVASLKDLAEFSSLPAERFAKEVTTRAFGGWNHRACERSAPRHIVFFDPGDAWIVDGRSVSHQAVYGHRVISIYARIAKSAIPTALPSYRDKVDAAIRHPRDPGNIHIYERDAVSPAGDIKESWTKVFGETGSGRVRRFDGAGMRSPDESGG